jgi:hypothetical protein
MRFPKLDRYLTEHNDLTPIFRKALELSELSKQCARFLPPDLADQLRVVQCKDGRLVLAAPSPALAAKLRLLAPDLAQRLSNLRGEAIVVSIKVQPSISRGTHGATQHHDLTAPRNGPALSPSTLVELRALHDRLPESPAKRALAALLRHHGAPAPS